MGARQLSTIVSRLTNRNYNPLSKGVLVLIGSLLLVGLACNMPLGNDSEPARNDEPQSFQDIAYQELGIDLSDIYLQGEQVVVTYDSPWIQDEASMLADWLAIMILALNEVPVSSEARIDVNHLEGPLFSVTSTRANVEAVQDGTVSVDDFYESLQFSERRTPAQVLTDKLASSGFKTASVKVEGGIVTIEFFQEQTDSTSDLLLEWIRLLDLAASYAPDSNQIVLGIIYPNAPMAQLEANTDDIINYRNGNRSPAEFLARLKPSL